MENYLPYIVSVLVAIITGVISYCSARAKSKAEIQSLQKSNEHEISKLMQQHKLDLDALERKHEMEIEKINLEHQHQLELLLKEAENKMGADLIQSMLGEAMKTPEARQAMGQAFKAPKKK